MEWKLADLRKSWISYFESKGHKTMPSASLLPAGDPTLLFTTAGMVQFKPFFAGTEDPPHSRLISIQKCLRTTDLESVGRTSRHCTFFEMLGNFSFGDYFKEGAIEMAYEFSIKHLKLDPEKIHITVYKDDDEAEKIWHEKIGIPMERITRLGKEDNWWGPAGESGACGPCSELYLDRGAAYCKPDCSGCKPGDECDRYMEYWNLVFNEFNQDTAGNLSPLPKQGIDTGAGLERIAALLNDLESVYDTDEMQQIIQHIESLVSEIENGKAAYNADTAAAYRVLTDHSRAVTFAITDGIRPDNTGRGYVLRRLIRRALLFARELNVEEPILYRLIPRIVEIYSPFYPDLAARKDEVIKIVRNEEDRFLGTLETGLIRFEEYLQLQKENKNSNLFSGEYAFRLYDTFGFPLELTAELAEKYDLKVDMNEFERLMNEQREAAAGASQMKDIHLPADLPTDLPEVQFTGYDHFQDKGKILAMFQNHTLADIDSSAKGTVYIITDRSPFYPEGGGQLGDTGMIKGNNGSFRVTDTQKKGKWTIHAGEMLGGAFKTGEQVDLIIDAERRANLIKHHSATHLLNKSLRDHLGDHILQTGSLVSPHYLRFDFSHPERIDSDLLKKIEEHVNLAIEKKAAVQAKIMPIEEAKNQGALATFGEKYGDTVRVIDMGDGEVSRELCGGCHVKNTAEVGYFHILKETSPGAGNRRIEAIAGQFVLTFFQEEFEKLQSQINTHNEQCQALKKQLTETEHIESVLINQQLPDSAELENRLKKGPVAVSELVELQEKTENEIESSARLLARLKKKVQKESTQNILSAVDEALQKAENVGQVDIVSMQFDGEDVQALRTFGDKIKEKNRQVLIILGTISEKGPILLCMANKGATAAGVHCGNIIKEAAVSIGGGGGGKADMAQAGGKNKEGLEDAIKNAAIIAKKQIGAS